MFNAEPWDRYAKTQRIQDDASDMVLYLDIDDVNPDEVNEHTASRIVAALYRETDAEVKRLREACDALLAAYDQSGLAPDEDGSYRGLSWLVPYMEAMRRA